MTVGAVTVLASHSLIRVDVEILNALLLPIVIGFLVASPGRPSRGRTASEPVGGW